MKRRTRWFDIAAGRTVLASAAGGTLASEVLLTESEIEDELEGAATLLRVVGDIYLSRIGTAPVVQMVMAVFNADQYLGYGPASFNAAGVEETCEQQGVIWNRLWGDIDLSFSSQRIEVDVRTKRKLLPNSVLVLFLDNWTLSAAADNAAYLYHLRALVALP